MAAEDQSHKAAEPLKPEKPSAFVKKFINPESPPAESPEAIENRQRAAREIGMIFELKDLTAFKWFVEEFIDKPYRAAFDALKTFRPAPARDGVEPETLESVQMRYRALREVKVGILEREINHREQINSSDSALPSLREELRRL